MRADPSSRQLALFSPDHVRWEQLPVPVRAQVLELVSHVLEHSLVPPSLKLPEEPPHVRQDHP